MINLKNTNKGITLIALVITVIVLLILAGVALATLTGDSGILSNAEKAKENTNMANAKEQVALAVQGALTKGLGTISEKDYLTDELDKLVKKYEIEDVTDGWKVKVDEYEVTISKNGAISEKKELSILERYILGETGTGISTENIVIIGEDYSITFKDNDIITNASTSIKTYEKFSEQLISIKENAIILDIEYNEEMYKVYADLNEGKTYKLEKCQVKQIYSGNKEISKEKIWDDFFTLDDDNNDVDFYPWKKYKFNLTVNGENITNVGYTIPNFWGFSNYPCVMVHFDGNFGFQAISLAKCIENSEEQEIFFFENEDYCSSNTVILNSIYEIGEVNNCLEENGFVSIKYDEGFVLCYSPEEECIIPETIDGVKVDYVMLDTTCIGPTITIEKPVGFYITGDFIRVETIKVNTTDLEFLKGLTTLGDASGRKEKINVDLTECGNNITIPEELINLYEGYADNNIEESGRIYVTETIKESYKDYDCVVVK